MSITTAPALHAVDAAEAALAALRSEALRQFELRHVDPLTRATMLSALRRLARTFSDGRCDNEKDFPWELLVDAADVLAIRASVLDSYGRATVARDLVALKQILRCCWKVGLLTYDQFKLLTDLPRLPPPGTAGPETYLTPTHIAALLAACAADPNTVKGLRDAAAILAAASTGVRRHELVAIETAALDLGHGLIHLTTTKGGLPRTAYLHSSAGQLLAEWLAVRGPHRHAFTPVTRSGRVLPDRHLSAHQFWKIFGRRCAEAGLPSSVTTHDLRRFTVSQLLNTTDLALVARVVGHRSPATTARYDTRPEQQCRDAVETLPLPAWVGSGAGGDALDPVDR